MVMVGGQELQEREVEVAEGVTLSLLCCEAFRGMLIGPEVDHTGMMIWPGASSTPRGVKVHGPVDESQHGHCGSRASSLQCHALLIHGYDTTAHEGAVHPWLGCVTASHMLCAFLVSIGAELRGTHCVELGSGVGLCGIVASKLCHQATLTDCSPQSLELLRMNVKKNCRDKDVAVAELAWGDEQHTQAVLASRGVADGLVLCSDVLYPTSTDKAIRGLLRTSRTLLQGEPTTQAGSLRLCGPHSEDRGRTGRLVVSFISRDGRGTLRRFLRLMHTEAFRITEVVDTLSSYRHGNAQARALGAFIIVLVPCKQEPTLVEALARDNSAFFAGIDEPDVVEEGEVWEQPFAEL